MAKKTISYVCENCSTELAGWQGQCPSCKEWNTIVEQQIATAVTKTIRKLQGNLSGPLSLTQVLSSSLPKQSTGLAELDRVLGHNGIGKDTEEGLTPGSVILLTGEPGVGKSTLLLQLGLSMSSVGNEVLYVSAEESLSQIGGRASRLTGDIELSNYSNFKLQNLYDLESIIEILTSKHYRTNVVFIDSIQTISSSQINGVPGGLAQIRYCAAELVSVAKQLGITLVLVGHITKEGGIAGPKLLEHLVDVVLQFSGDKISPIRYLRSSKNRFGSTDEVGLFLMQEKGLICLNNPGEYFLNLSQTGPQIGTCRSVVMEGLRPIVVEIQSLVVPSEFSLPRRVSEGLPLSRVQLITAVLSKYLKVKLQNYDVYVNVAQGVKIDDRGADLAIAMAILSSLKNKTLDHKLIFFGELSLSGHIVHTAFADKRLKEIRRLGYDQGAKGKSHITDVQYV